jgi:hypothetical protein
MKIPVIQIKLGASTSLNHYRPENIVMDSAKQGSRSHRPPQGGSVSLARGEANFSVRVQDGVSNPGSDGSVDRCSYAGGYRNAMNISASSPDS